MKRRVTQVISAALAATLLTATAASAAPRDRFSRPAPRSQSHNSSAAALGFGLFALGALAIIASQSNRNTARYDDRYYAPPPPPSYGNSYYYGPSTDYSYDRNGYGPNSYSSNGYGQTYGQGYAPYDPYDYRR